MCPGGDDPSHGDGPQNTAEPSGQARCEAVDGNLEDTACERGVGMLRYGGRQAGRWLRFEIRQRYGPQRPLKIADGASRFSFIRRLWSVIDRNRGFTVHTNGRSVVDARTVGVLNLSTRWLTSTSQHS